MDVNIFNSKNTTEIVKNVQTISSKFQKQLIKLAVACIQNQQIKIEKLNFDDAEMYTKENIYDFIGVYIALIKLFVHSTKEEFDDKLLQVGFTQSFLDKFPIKQENKPLIIKNSNVWHCNLLSIKWRIDRSLSYGILKRKVPPWIVINFTLTSGKKYTFVMDLALFHKLRFNVALMLKELYNLKTLMKIS